MNFLLFSLFLYFIMSYEELILKKTFSLCKFPISLNNFLNVYDTDLSKGSIRLIMRQTFYRLSYSGCIKCENIELIISNDICLSVYGKILACFHFLHSISLLPDNTHTCTSTHTHTLPMFSWDCLEFSI